MRGPPPPWERGQREWKWDQVQAREGQELSQGNAGQVWLGAPPLHAHREERAR